MVKKPYDTEYFEIVVIYPDDRRDVYDLAFFRAGRRGQQFPQSESRVAAIVCFSFAGLDEFHQSFVAGRSSSRTDVLIDSAGALCGILISRIFRMRRRKRRK